MSADISFASFNLYNFQKSGLKTYGRKAVTASEYEEKKSWTRDMLLKANADVVAFQELWHKDCLDDVLNTPELSDYKAVYIAPEWYNIAVAMIIRSPWELAETAEVIKNFPFSELIKLDDHDGEDDEVSVSINRFSRSILKVKLKHSESGSIPEITVFACHLRSKLPSSAKSFNKNYQNAVGSAISTIRRTAEATALRMILIDHMQGAGTPTVVIGDLNDDTLSSTLSLITDQPTMSKSSRGGDKHLYNTLQFQQLKSFNDVYYTHEYNNHKGVLDHILVSEEFFEYSGDYIWTHKQTQVWNDHIQDDELSSSDHGIVMSLFEG